jgi:ABC-type antimicrobial peptide transport system permease subunit
LNIFKELSKDHLVIVVSHDTDNSLVYGDRVITLEDGKVISDKTKRYQPNLAAYKKEYQMKVDSAFKNTPKDESELKDTFTRTITKVPFKQALKIGTESFKKKKVHFIITMFLTVVALAVFAVANIMRAYSPVEASLMTFDKLDIKTLMLVNTMEKEDTEQGSGGMISFIEDTREETVFTVPLAEAVENKINGVMRAYRFNVRIPSIDGNQLNRYNLNRERQLYNTIYTNTITIFTELNNNGQISDFYDAKVILGRMPQENQTAVEIMISDYTADSIMFFGGRFSAGEVVYPNTGHEQILDKIFVYNGIPLKIVGIFDTDYEKVLAYYLENPTANMKNDFRAKFNLTNIYTASLTSNAAIYSQMQKNPLTPVQLALYTGDGSDYLDISAMYLIDANTIGEQFAATNSLLPEDIIFYDGATADTVIGDNDLVLPFSYISGLLGNVDFENLTAAMLGGLQFNISVIDENHKKLYTNPNILAVYNDEALSNDLEQERSIILLSADKRNEALLVNLVIANLYVPIGESEKANSQLLNYFDSNNLWYMTYATGELKAFSELFFIISDLLNWVSLIMFVFVLILISNFIASGIKAKTHEIGVLRALGARGKDVAKIFAIEGGVIFILQVLFSYMMIFIGVMCLNALLTKAFVTTLVLLRVSPLSLLLVALIGAFTVSLASVLPLSRLTKMKPAEVMRARE